MPDGPITSNVPLESGLTMRKPVIAGTIGTTVPRVTVSVPPFALPAASTAIMYWPGKDAGVSTPVRLRGMTATVK